jgi:hypothetical protein
MNTDGEEEGPLSGLRRLPQSSIPSTRLSDAPVYTRGTSRQTMTEMSTTQDETDDETDDETGYGQSFKHLGGHLGAINA